MPFPTIPTIPGLRLPPEPTRTTFPVKSVVLPRRTVRTCRMYTQQEREVMIALLEQVRRGDFGLLTAAHAFVTHFPDRGLQTALNQLWLIQKELRSSGGFQFVPGRKRPGTRAWRCYTTKLEGNRIIVTYNPPPLNSNTRATVDMRGKNNIAFAALARGANLEAAANEAGMAWETLRKNKAIVEGAKWAQVYKTPAKMKALVDVMEKKAAAGNAA